MIKPTTFPSNSFNVQAAFDTGLQNYFSACRQRISEFVLEHFHYPGALKTNRTAFGWDLLRAPANLFWAPIYAFICVIRFGLAKHEKTTHIYHCLKKVPAGLPTDVQRSITKHILEDLLQQNNSSGNLQFYIRKELRKAYQLTTNQAIDEEAFVKKINPLIEDALIQYRVTRTASADISNTLSCTILGAFTLKKFTPGGIALGLVLAALISQHWATQNFFLGETLGQLYYNLFPLTPSLTLTMFTSLGVMTLLSVIAALSGVVTDPLQAKLGLHQKRLQKLINQLESDFVNNAPSNFRPKDQYIARILDAFDLLRSGLH